MEEKYLRQIIISLILIGLIVIVFFILKPILLSIILGVILAFVFLPVYSRLCKIIKSKNISASILTAAIILLVIFPVWFLTPIIINQSIKVYLASQQVDFVTPLKKIFPDLFASETFSTEVGSTIQAFVTKTTNYLVNSFSNLILNFPTLLLHSFIVFFTFFFVIRDKDSLIKYIQSLLPFPEDVEKKLFEASKAITTSVIYGQVIIGIIQGIIVGIGFLIFKIPNALLLTLLASVAGILPIVGTTIIWLPVVIYLLIGGNTFSAVGVTMFGIVSATIDNIIRPAFVSIKAKMHPLMVFIGMIGGLFLFGIIGFILGPLIIAYTLIILEIYRTKRTKGMLVPQ